MPVTVWGIEHGYIRTGDLAYMRHTTMEEQAADYAKIISDACTRTTLQRQFHILGGSVGALMAQKTSVAAQRLGTRPRVVVLIDPPPPGPASFEQMPSTAWIAAEAIRLGQQIAAHEVDFQRILAVLGKCAGCSALLKLPSGPVATKSGLSVVTCDDTPDLEWELAIAVTHELADLVQASRSVESIRITKRRMEVYRQHLKLWANQSAIPKPLTLSQLSPPQLFILLSSLRHEFFHPVHGERNADSFHMYGDFEILAELPGEHTDVVQRVCTGREPHITSLISTTLLENMQRA